MVDVVKDVCLEMSKLFVSKKSSRRFESNPKTEDVIT